MPLVRRGRVLEPFVMQQKLTDTLGSHRLLFLSVMTFTSSRKPSFTPRVCPGHLLVSSTAWPVSR